MGWIVFGFVFAIFLEKCFTVFINYEKPEQKEQTKVQVSLPWYGWGLLGYATLKSHKRKHRR